MGTFHYTIEIGDPEGQEFEAIDALVDTGASYTTLPSSLLQRLGVLARGTRRFEMADGRTIELGIGQTWIRIGNESMIRVVVFSNEDRAILGADTLEGLGLAVDPVRKRLVPVPGLLVSVARPRTLRGRWPSTPSW